MHVFIHAGHLVKPSTPLEPSTEGLELRDAPYQQPHQLVQVLIEFSDLGVESEGITLYADATTTTKLVTKFPTQLAFNVATHYAGTSLVALLQDLGASSPACTHSYRAAKMRKRKQMSSSVWCLLGMKMKDCAGCKC